MLDRVEIFGDIKVRITYDSELKRYKGFILTGARTSFYADTYSELLELLNEYLCGD